MSNLMHTANKTRILETEHGGFRFKSSAPRGYRYAISRGALLTRVLECADARVILLQAPAGQGKTTLLQQLQAAFEAQGCAVGWMSMDGADNDVRRFHLHLVALISEMRRSAAPLADEGQAGDDFRSGWLIAQLLEIGTPVRLILDDLHAIGSRATLNVIRELIDNAPEGVQFVIGSRTLPDIGISRRVVNDDAVILRADELSFSREEARRFLSAGDDSLSERDIGLIHRQTEGWPAALQLYRLALENPTVRQSLHRMPEFRPRELAEYLSENVLSSLADEMRDFLLQSSILPRMSAELCDAVLGRSDSASMLASVEKAGLFIRRLSEDGQWSVYHTLFRSFLEEQFRLASRGSERQIRMAAAHWFLERGYLEDAIAQYLAAGDHSSAAGVLDRWSDQLIPDAYLATVVHWSERIPLKELEERPGLNIKIIWAHVFLRHHQKMRPLLALLDKQIASPVMAHCNADPSVVLAMVDILNDDLQRAARRVEGVDVQQATSTAFRDFELSAACNARGYAQWSEGRFASAHENFKRARELSAPTGTSFAWAYSMAKSSLARISQGYLQEASLQLRTSMADPRMYADQSMSQASLVSAHVLALYEANELDAAEARFGRFKDIIADAALHDYLLVAYLSMSRISDIRGQPARAIEMLDEADAICFASKWPRASNVLNWERVRRELAIGSVDRALALFDRCERNAEAKPNCIRFSEEVDGATIGMVRLLAHTAPSHEVLAQVQPLLESAHAQGWVRRQIKLQLLAAIAYQRDLEEAAALRHLEEAIRLATPGGFVRTFGEEGRVIGQLLSTYLQRCDGPPAPERRFLSALCEVMGLDVGESHRGSGSYSLAGQDAFRPLEPFTKKEKQILALLVEYASNEDIANKMHLSKDGIKYHIKNIYGKLAVNNRIQAIKVAKRLKLD